MKKLKSNVIHLVCPCSIFMSYVFVVQAQEHARKA
jgi:hypothetical protein